jgi:hypothetical protein
VRVLACVLGAAVVFVASAAAGPSAPKALLVRDGNRLAILYVGRTFHFRQPLITDTKGALAFSGDGDLISIGSKITSRGVTMPGPVVWAPTGERAAAVSPKGGVVVWTPSTGKRVVAPDRWGAQSVAWSDDGALAIGRMICPHTCRYGTDRSIWVWRNGRLAQRLGPFPHGQLGMIPLPFAWVKNDILWWWWPGSGSIASDGVALYRNDTKLGTMLMHPNWLAVCGSHVAFSEGGDRETMDDKQVVFDGRVVSDPPAHSWAGLACTAGGRLVGAASANGIPRLTTETHRSIWQLLPTRRRLTRPPLGWSDEQPQLFPNGDLLFVRTRAGSTKTGPSTWTDTQKGKVMLLAHGKLRQLAEVGFTQPDTVYTYPVEFYGYYDWSQLLAVTP